MTKFDACRDDFGVWIACSGNASDVGAVHVIARQTQLFYRRFVFVLLESGQIRFHLGRLFAVDVRLQI